MNQTAEHLLLRAATALLRVQNQEDAESFNLFTVLRSGRDEVNLHSRFLHALLNHQLAGKRENLAAFLKHLSLEKTIPYPHTNSVAVYRERKNIDLYIADSLSKSALLIENKLYAADQPKQLERYYETLAQEFPRRHVIYLTLDRREPPEPSRGKVPKEAVSCVSYEDLLPWLNTCHDLAHDEPELRSSISQYRQLVRRLTGGGLGRKRMQTMKDLIRETGLLASAKTLGAAAAELHVDITSELWKAIEKEIEKALGDTGLTLGRLSDTSPKRIKKALGFGGRGGPGWHGLYYPLSSTPEGNQHWLSPGPSLGVELDTQNFWFGVRCLKNDVTQHGGVQALPGAYAKLKPVLDQTALESRNSLEASDWWPGRWRVLPDSDSLKLEHVAILGNDKEREALAKQVAAMLRTLLDTLKEDERTRELF